MRIVVINGSGGVGKDTFVGFCDIYNTGLVRNISSVDRVKHAAELLGWDGAKAEKGRQFLSDLKDLSTAAYEGPLRYMKKEIESCAGMNYAFIFVHIREPQEIARFVAEVPGVETLLIRRDGVGSFGNHADSNVENYPYDHIIENNGALTELKEAAIRFMEEGNALG